MAHNALIRVAWNVLTDLHASEMAAFDAAQFASINGDAGGTWAPAAAITIGGAGLVVTAFGHFTADVAIDGTLAVNSLAQFTSDVALGTNSANYLHINSTATFNSPAIFSSTLTANGFSHFTANVAIDGTLAVNSLAGFSAGISVTGTALVTGASTLAGVTCSTLAASGATTCSSTLVVTGATTCNGSLTVNGALNIANGGSLQRALVASSDGRIVKRVTSLSSVGADTSAYGPVNSDVVYVNSMTADATFTINGGVDGDEIRFINKSSTHFLTISDPSTGIQIALKNVVGQSYSALLMRIGGSFVTISQDLL